MSELLDLVLGWAAADDHHLDDPIAAEALELGCYIARLAAADHQDPRVVAVRNALLVDTGRRVAHRRYRQATIGVGQGRQLEDRQDLYGRAYIDEDPATRAQIARWWQIDRHTDPPTPASPGTASAARARRAARWGTV